MKLIRPGATVIDIGAEATGPKAIPLTPAEEWSRLEPILSTIIPIRRGLTATKISVDTRHPEVAEKSLALNIDWINECRGLTHPAMRKVLARNTCDIVVMHNLGVPVSKAVLLEHHQDPTESVWNWAQQQLDLFDKENIDHSRIIFDIGIGYGKTAEHSLELLQKIEIFHKLGVRLLVGHSRKSFLQQFTPHAPIDRDLETTILSLYLASKNIDYVRVHNVDFHARAFKVARAVTLDWEMCNLGALL